MSNNKVRTTIWIEPEALQRIEGLFPAGGCKSRSEFISKAVDFYCGYLQTDQASGYISQTLLSQMQGALNLIESKICRVIFKLAVELSISMNITAAVANIDDEILRKLRIRCTDDVKKSLGSVQLDRIYDVQNKRFMEDDI